MKENNKLMKCKKGNTKNDWILYEKQEAEEEKEINHGIPIENTGENVFFYDKDEIGWSDNWIFYYNKQWRWR